MQKPDRALADRPHAVVKASAPGLSPRTWLACLAENVSCVRQSFTRTVDEQWSAQFRPECAGPLVITAFESMQEHLHEGVRSVILQILRLRL
jgi:hypothetical protein